MPATSQLCTVCGRVRQLDELLEVTEVATGRVRWVCRGVWFGSCLSVGVGSREVDRIALAVPPGPVRGPGDGGTVPA